MGSWSVSCGISNIAITSGNKCVLLPIKESRGSDIRNWQPATLPIFAEYNDYGGVENIEKDDNTELIENHFGITIEEFAEFLVDGKFTYDREEAKAISNKMKNLEEAAGWRFMWIDRQVYDFMILNHDEYNKGHMNYGTKEMLNLFGFEFVEKSDKFDNYDSKRFNQLWKKGDVKLYSDGHTLLAGKNHYVYNFGKGDETSIETYFEVPQELEYLKEKNESEAWRLMDEKDAKIHLSSIFGSRYDFDSFSSMMLENFKTKKALAPKILYKKYYADLERFGDRIAHLSNVNHNLHPMSGQFAPHVLYLTPQCGEYEEHQKILEKFAEINKSYLSKYD